MNNVRFNPEITLSTGTSGPVTFNVRQIIEFGPHPIAGTTVHTQPAAGGFFFTDKTHVSESPGEIARLILRAVHAWRYDALKPKSAKESDSGCQMGAGKAFAPEQNVYKETRFCPFEQIDRCLVGVYLENFPPENMAGPSDVRAHKLNSRPLEIPGKDAVRASRISAEEFAQGLEKLRGGPEAGADRVKYAEGAGTVSMPKLREALGALQQPGAQIVAKGMAEDRLRDALAQFAASLDVRRTVGMVTVGEIETLIIQTLEAGGKITIDAAGHEFRADAPPDRREYFKSRRGH